MNAPEKKTIANWQDDNNACLSLLIKLVHTKFEHYFERASNAPQVNLDAIKNRENAMTAELEQFQGAENIPAITILARQFNLSEFELQILYLLVVFEIDGSMPSLCAQFHNNPALNYPTFGMAMTLFPNPEWGAISPRSTLRYFCILNIHKYDATTLLNSPITLDERIVNYIKGLNHLDDKLTPYLLPVRGQGNLLGSKALVESHAGIVKNICNQLSYSERKNINKVVSLSGDHDSKNDIALGVSSSFGLFLYHLNVNALPQNAEEFDRILRVIYRESYLSPIALLVLECDQLVPGRNNLDQIIDKTQCLTILDAKPDALKMADVVSVEIEKPTVDEQAGLWLKCLPDSGKDLARKLADQFSFSQKNIEVLSGLSLDNLWFECRKKARSGLGQLAQKVSSSFEWDDLILEDEAKSLLRQLAEQVVNRHLVYREWGFSKRLSRGLGISALFSGESGTGKTMAAEVIANELNLDLYKIDLSSVVSKYIGETEKNLKKVFDLAEESGAILFFDEADALFGQRSEVKDSHDRYANIEVNYLLQRMESYSGLAILATNMKSSMDNAFIRRLRFVVDFKLPDVTMRERIWQRVFPTGAPISEDVDCKRLAKINLTGGNIQSIALNSAFDAASQNSIISMNGILKSARSEFKKLDKPFKETDFIVKSHVGDVA